MILIVEPRHRLRWITGKTMTASAVLLALSSPAIASREVESLGLVPRILGDILGDAIGTMLVGGTILGFAVVLALLVVARRTSRARSSAPLHFTLSAPLGQGPHHSAPATAGDGTAQQRQAEMRARVEALTLKPRSGGFSAVDADARARIAAAASRMEARARAARLEQDQADAQAGSSDD